MPWASLARSPGGGGSKFVPLIPKWMLYGGGVPSPGGVPQPLVVPTISPLPIVHAVASTCSQGTWSNTPTGYTYQWYYQGGAAIAGANAASYTSVIGDVGKSIYCVVTATNAAGNTSVSTAASPIT